MECPNCGCDVALAGDYCVCKKCGCEFVVEVSYITKDGKSPRPGVPPRSEEGNLIKLKRNMAFFMIQDAARCSFLKAGEIAQRWLAWIDTNYVKGELPEESIRRFLEKDRS